MRGRTRPFNTSEAAAPPGRRRISRTKGLPIQTILDTSDLGTLLGDEEQGLSATEEAGPAVEELDPNEEREAFSLPGSADSLDLFLNEIGRYPLLTAAEEVVLAKAVERGSSEAKERMINCNLRLVVSIAKRYRGRGVPFGDLIQDGVIGLNRAVEKFDHRKGFKFSTYATWLIRQSVQRSVAGQSRTIRVPTHVHERRNKLAAARRKIEPTLGRPATHEELAEASGLSLLHVDEALDIVEARVSLNRPIGNEDDGELGDLFADENADDPEERADELLRGRAVRLALAELPELERRILELRYGLDGEPHSLEAIGAELGISRERIRRLEGEALDSLAETLGEGDELALSA